MSQHLSPLAFRSRVLLLAFALSVGACSSAPKQELDPVDELPQIQRINVKAERIQRIGVSKGLLHPASAVTHDILV
jgi:hypothetical protein